MAAVKEYRKVLETDYPKIAEYPHLANLYKIAKKRLCIIYQDIPVYGKAIECFNQLLEVAPEDKSAYYRIGWCHEERYDFPRAIEYYKKYLELEPKGKYSALAESHLREITRILSQEPGQKI